MKNLFNGKKKGISLLIICLLLVGLLVVIRYTSLNKNTTTSLTASGDNKESNSPINENKENNEAIPQTENNDNIENTNITKEDSKENSSTQEENSSNDKSSNNTQNNNNNNSTENSKPSGGSSNNTTSKPENKPTTPSKPENKPSTPNNGGGSSSHSHNWVAQTKQVHHKEQGHYENVLVKPAWTEKVPVYEERERSICNGCGADITADPYTHNENHMLNGEKGGWHSEWEKVQVGTKTVKHDAVYSKKWVVDKKAWTETVVTGHKCSGCGQTK